MPSLIIIKELWHVELVSGLGGDDKNGGHHPNNWQKPVWGDGHEGSFHHDNLFGIDVNFVKDFTGKSTLKFFDSGVDGGCWIVVMDLDSFVGISGGGEYLVFEVELVRPVHLNGFR